LQVFDHNERSEWREFCNGAPSPSTAVQSQRSEDRLTEAPGGCPGPALRARTDDVPMADIELTRQAANRASFLCD